MSGYTSPEYHPAAEEYCETIFELAEDGLKVIQARIAERLEVSRPAVSEMITKLSEQKLIRMQGPEISLTSKGEALAQTMVRRHRLAERFLTDLLGLSWAEAHHEAGKWEHVISPAVEAAMTQKLENPTTCPHGNPIPGSGYRESDSEVLATVPVGESRNIVRITEELEFTPGLLEYFESNKIRPGETIKVIAASDEGDHRVFAGGNTVEISRFAAERIFVDAKPA